MSQMTLTQEELQEALSFFLNQRILRIPHNVTQVKVKKSEGVSSIPKEFMVELEKTESASVVEKPVTSKTPVSELGKGKGKGPLEAAIKK